MGSKDVSEGSGRILEKKNGTGSPSLRDKLLRMRSILIECYISFYT